MARVTALEAENKALQEALDELEQKKEHVVESSVRLGQISSQIKRTAQVFPTIAFTREQSVDWLKMAHDDSDPLVQAFGATSATLEVLDEKTNDENLKVRCFVAERAPKLTRVLSADADGESGGSTVSGIG